MYEFKTVSDRWYPVKLPSGKLLHLEPPKLKTLNKVQKTEGDMEALAQAAALLLSKNREKYKIRADDVLEMLTIDQLAGFMTDFLDWVNGEKASDPN